MRGIVMSPDMLLSLITSVSGDLSTNVSCVD